MMRHRVDVMRPPENLGTRGQSQGNPILIHGDWPCSIESLSGREILQVRTVFAEATHKVKGYGHPSSPIRERDYLTGGSIGSRTLSINFIKDELQNGISLELICGERTGG